MSCITEILKLKGDKEILPIPDNKGIVVEHGGNYKGYEYLITFNDMGFRCGYVAIDDNHPLNKNDNGLSYPDLSVHGGITFFQESHLSQSILGHRCTDKWLGFDAGHYYDIVDLKCTQKYFPSLREAKMDHVLSLYRIFEKDQMDHEIRTCSFMENECKKLINQLIDQNSKDAINHESA